MARSGLVSISVGYPNLFNVKLTNTQNVDTPSPFQQMLQLPVSQLQSYTSILASDFHNIRFVYNGTGIPAWLESINNGVATIWVKLPVSIPANSSITIDMEVDPSLNFDGVYWGENPILSSTYAQYDDGASVFNNYWNFAGTSTPSGIYTVSGALSAPLFNNGFTAASSNVNYVSFIYFEFNSSDIIEANTISTSSDFSMMGVGTSTPTGSSWVYPGSGTYGWYSGYSTYWQHGQTGSIFVTTSSSAVSVASPTPSTNFTVESFYAVTGTQIWGLGITGSMNTLTSHDSTYTIPTTAYGVIGNENYVTTNWLRTRAYPPNGVMPSVEVIA